MKKAVIIDDEPLARSVILEYLAYYPDITVVQECGDGFEGRKAIAQHQPDLVFLDIQMPKISGFEMLELLDQVPPVIFTTAFDNYAIKAFETHAVDYLLKPFSRERFQAAVSKWMSYQQPLAAQVAVQAMLESGVYQAEQHQRVVVKTGGNIRIVPVSEIHYFEADDDYVTIHTADSSFLKDKTMQHFERILDPALFVRVHRSYIVQVQQITRIEPYEKESHIAVLRSGAKIPLSKTGYPKLKKVLGL